MAGRGGATTVLEGKQVLLVGCGSVGGRIAWELARSGALNLTIVDDDFLTPDNTFRHVLGRHYWYINKALALKQELEKQIPYLPIEAIPGRIEELIEDGSVDFGRYGLLVFAVGNPTVELAMNQTIRSLANPPRTVFTWLEPLGIGGHALLVQPGVRGCYGCLFADSRDDPDGMFNKSAFAARGQKFGRALNGCGSMHTPYGSLDAASTANLAVRLALDALTGREAGSPLRSWKGDPGQFVSEGYALSNRFGLSDKELLDYRFAYVSESCQVCGTGFKGGQPVLVR